mgnify:CR=1 FL=1
MDDLAEEAVTHLAVIHGIRMHQLPDVNGLVMMPGNERESGKARLRPCVNLRKIAEEDSRRRDKPTWQVDVCAALPDDRTLIGGAAR